MTTVVPNEVSTDAGEPYDPTVVSIIGLANAMESFMRPYTCEDGTRSAGMRMGDAQAKAVAEALRALARTFDDQKRREMPAPCQRYIEFPIGEQGYLAALAAVRATLEKPQPRPEHLFWAE